jgi:hypothetical protein
MTPVPSYHFPFKTKKRGKRERRDNLWDSAAGNTE